HRDPEHRARRLSPFHLLDHFGVGLLDENADPGERLPPPITQLLDSRIDQMSVASFSFLRAALPLSHGCCRFLHGRVRVGSLSTIATTSLADSRLPTFVGRKRARTTPCLSTRMVVGAATSSPCSPAPGCSTEAASTSLCSGSATTARCGKSCCVFFESSRPSTETATTRLWRLANSSCCASS